MGGTNEALSLSLSIFFLPLLPSLPPRFFQEKTGSPTRRCHLSIYILFRMRGKRESFFFFFGEGKGKKYSSVVTRKKKKKEKNRGKIRQ